MRISSDKSLIVVMLVAIALIVLSLFLFQSAWLKMIQSLLNSSQSAGGLPISSTPLSGLSIPTAAAAVQLGVESVHGNLAITVTRVVNPANAYVGNTASYTTLKQGEQYLLVDIKVRCLSSTETCRLTEFDFGVESKAGHDYPAELSGNFSGLKGLFEGGEIQPGKSLSGSLVFVIQSGEQYLVLFYPRMFGFGGESRFLLTK